jgi:choline dehydrogenase-like flavoprotein
MLPFLEEDVGEHTAGWGGAWGVEHAELMAHLPVVEAIFGLDPKPYDLEPRLDRRADEPASFALRSPKWPQFSARNVASIYRKEIESLSSLTVWLNATVVSFRFEGSRCCGLTARAANGPSISVTARHVVIAAGAIESTRLMLLMNRSADGRMFSSLLGQHFSDHLSAPVAEIMPRNRKLLNKTFAFKFVPRGMRNIRLELDGPTRRRLKLAGAFAHVSFSEQRDGGFTAVRRLYQALQRRSSPSFADLKLLARSSPWLLKAAYWRFVERTVLAAKDATWHAHVVTEQRPEPSNRVFLSATTVDPFGLPLAVIDWRVTPADVDHFNKVTSLFSDEWRRRNLDRMGEYVPRTREAIATDLLAGGGIYHPAGSTRIGSSKQDGVVSSTLQPFDTEGLHVVSTSVFPTGGGANPSLMLLLFALRTAEEIARSLRI